MKTIPFHVVFNQALSNLQSNDTQFYNALVGSVSAEQAKDFEQIKKQAEKRFESLRSKQLEKQGGYNFNTSADNIDINFTNQ